MIPKIIHIAWNDKNVLESKHPLVVNGLLNIKKLNPDWDIQINDDKDIDYYLKNNLTKSDYNLIKDIHIVAKSDIWRLYKIYNEGGLYVDIDRLCNKSIDSFLQDNLKWVLPVCSYQDFSHDFMMSAPGNPVYKNVIALYFQRRYEGSNNIYFLGAETYMHGITLSFFGKIIRINPGKEIFSEMIEVINQNKFIKTYIEDLPGVSIFYDGGISFDEWADMKKSFYAENNIKHWTEEW